MSFEIVQGDIYPAFIMKIVDEDEDIDEPDLDGATCTLLVEFPNGATATWPLIVHDAEAGEVRRQFAEGDTDQVGPHSGQVVVVKDDKTQTYPADGSRVIWFVNPRVGSTL